MGVFPTRDLTERLLDVKRRGAICAEAAAEIGRLRAEVEQLKYDIDKSQAVVERLTATLGIAMTDCLAYATQHVGIARDQFLNTATDIRRTFEQNELPPKSPDESYEDWTRRVLDGIYKRR